MMIVRMSFCISEKTGLERSDIAGIGGLRSGADGGAR